MNFDNALLIRPILASEFAAEAQLIRGAYSVGPYAEQLADDPVWARTEADTLGRNRDGVVLVAEREGQLLGAASVLRGGTEYSKLAAEGEAELRLVCVAPSAQGQGLGEALVRAGLEEALQWGVPVLRLDTGERNPAQHLYERIGFERTPERDEQVSGAGYGHSLSYAYALQSSTEVRVRIAREAEYEAIGELAVGAYGGDYEGLGESYLSEIANVRGRAAVSDVWVAEDVATGELLGTVTSPYHREWITGIAQPDELDIRLLAVSQAARGRGIGALLTLHAVRLSEIRGLKRLVFETSPSFVGAWKLYDRLGFERLTERDREFVRDDGTVLKLLTYASPLRVEAAAA